MSRTTEGQVPVAGGSALLKRPLLLGALALLIAIALAVTLFVTKPWASPKDRTDVAAPAPGDRVLQSVDVTMQGNGALTRVADTVVVARAQGSRSDTYSTTYDPTKVVDQLPVRVLTAYQTDQGSGTDLADLKGYSGRVTINLTVQNLTVKPQRITYDVAGKSQTTTALVGAPLTVVASAALPGVDPATVVTAAADAPTDPSTDAASTNGVLSKAADGTAQVQWASILAPPQLDSTATFRVVLDAKDFVVPTVDLSVQPGLVTDPSVGALIDSAFNPKNSDELALEKRTIALIGDVNDVLGRASGTISGVRKTLDASSKTLGTKTVQSLTEDTKTVSTSLKSSSDNVDALGDALKSSLQTTQSSTLQRMSETVSGLQDLIGDTSAAVPAVTVKGTGCAATVSAPTSGQGVYAGLLSVTAQLDAYATTTEGCKKELQDSITTTIGVVKKDGTADCDAAATSVVCSLQAAQDQFTEAVVQVTTAVAAAKVASVELDPAAASTSAGQLRLVSGRLAALVDGLLGDEAESDGGKALQEDVDVARLADLEQALEDVVGDPDEDQPSLARVSDNLSALSVALRQINTTATQNAGEKADDPAPPKAGEDSPTTPKAGEDDPAPPKAGEDAPTTPKAGEDDPTTAEAGEDVPAPPKVSEIDSMLVQNKELADRLCRDATAGTLPAAEVRILRGYLVSEVCPGDDPKDVPPPPPNGKPMEARLESQKALWATLRDQTSATGDLVSGLDTAQKDLAGAVKQLNTTREALAKDRTTLAAVLKDINDARKKADETVKDLASMSDHVDGVETGYRSAHAALTRALDAAHAAASTAQASDLQQEIKQVAGKGQESKAGLDKAFTSSSRGLSAAADQLRDGTAQTLKKQQTDLARQEKSDEAALSDQTRAGLSSISDNVTSASRDIDTTRTTLTRDLDNVLLDLGRPNEPGKGLLGTLGKSARSADSADFQLGLASDTVSSYSSVRSQEVGGILLRQAQAEAALQRQAELPAFATELPATTTHRTVYLFHLGANR